MKWFIEIFLPSFGFCKDKQISEKQANIFIKYLKNTKEHECSTDYSDMIDGKNIFLQESIEWAGYRKTTRRYYLTIK